MATERTDYHDLIITKALAHGLEPALVEAIVIHESGGRADAFRYEPAFYRRYLADDPKYAGMIPRRVSSSYGLMQILYSTARLYGFSGEPELLFVPSLNLSYGCKHLLRLMGWAEEDHAKAVAAYNGGQGNWQAEGPQKYARAVLQVRGELVALLGPYVSPVPSPLPGPTPPVPATTAEPEPEPDA